MSQYEICSKARAQVGQDSPALLFEVEGHCAYSPSFLNGRGREKRLAEEALGVVCGLSSLWKGNFLLVNSTHKGSRDFRRFDVAICLARWTRSALTSVPILMVPWLAWFAGKPEDVFFRLGIPFGRGALKKKNSRG